MGDVKYMTRQEFIDAGLLQELNRRFLHPLGLALEMGPTDDEEDDEAWLGGIWDYRDDPEGIVFNDLSDNESITKADRFEALVVNQCTTRRRHLGWTVQPIGDVRGQEGE